MWFENAIYKEKIKHMFNNELSIEHVEVEIVSFYAHSSLRLGFHSKNILTTFPDKWNKSEFNALSILLELGDIIHFECKGISLGFECTPTIEYKDNKIHMSIFHNNFYFNCIAQFLTIRDITPYLDERWD
ncbi:Imm50 family immunity protein [Photorhabdus bodei]|uniref:Immunity protein 50 n=1 Tax=Photorhabdus bodei TaxID=2029681 RepID=A0ABX0AXM4_9GAMM|nr:Imm50 family immunity protein [Photorhabdus bodei]NDL01550.1 hypothetical protein [Photorhabdus bodei]NDL05324.1 hypothetical protein [Photorhabdus bodei]NDL09719.1 hypothetical protein [Photorhabdus bodei]